MCRNCQPLYRTEKRERKDAEHERENAERERKTAERHRLDQLRQNADKVIVTTTNHVEGCVVKQYLGVESVEFVVGTGIFSEITTDFQDFFGKRPSAFERKLQTAKEQSFKMLRLIAAKKGANAVIGIDLDYSEFAGNRVALIINGTLVKVARRASQGEVD